MENRFLFSIRALTVDADTCSLKARVTMTVHTRKAVQQLKSLGQVAQFANEKLDAKLPDEFILKKVREIGLTYAETQQQS